MLRSSDIFVKPRADLRSKSAAGGIITLIASSTALILFVAQIYWYIVGSTSHTLHLTESLSIPMTPKTTTDPFQSRVYDVKGKMPLKLHITFPHIPCKNLEVKLNSAPLTKHDFDFRSSDTKVNQRPPNAVEIRKAGLPSNHRGGCTIQSQLRVPKVAGHVTITLTKEAWTHALNQLMLHARQTEGDKEDLFKNEFNVSHYVHTVQFGKRFHKAAAYPLENRKHLIQNNMGGIALENIQVKLVPTIYTSWFTSKNTYQMSVIAHAVQPEAMVMQGMAMLPGLSLGYDVTPLAVHHDEGRDNIIVFLSSLVSIVGGVFVTVGLLTGCIVHSAAAVAKKVD
eukprot:Nitzschia sp. Nitz4//scaffold48_size128905//7344//8360//NITZ4_003575-RA/size128905-processed-gene-0.102-mRNA-1//-1//CDS//3329552907//3549//frame0